MSLLYSQRIDCQQVITTDDTLVRAALLHNKLLHRAIGHDYSIKTERVQLKGFLQVSEVDENFHLHPLHQFLSLIETTHRSENWGVFTPRLYQPFAPIFWDEAKIDEDYVLLYSQNNGDAPMDGGIYYNLQTGSVIRQQSS